MELCSAETLALLFAVATLAGAIDAMAGGGGLLTIPAMLSVGIPPVQTLATNKLQACGGSVTASLYFIRAGLVNIRTMGWPIICTFAGSATGTLLVQQVNTEFLVAVIPVLLIAIALYFLLSKNLSGGTQRISLNTFAWSIGFSIGFYDGFFGPGTGSFFAIACVALLGHSLTRATAHTKVLNGTSNVASLIFFILGGQVLWRIGLVMMVGQFLGASIGSRLVVSKGQRLIRPLIVLVCLVMSARLIIQNGL